MTHIKKQQFDCDNCSFKADTKEQINDHMNASHKDPTPIKCSFCPDTFIDRKNIFAHRKQRHSTYKACRNGQNCAYIESCSFNHKPVTEGASICYHCGDEFTSTNDLLLHRKNTHGNIICTKFLKGECKKNPCWYAHITEGQQTAAPTQPEGFWRIQSAQIPPERKTQIQTNPTITSIMEMLKTQQSQINQMTQALQILASNKSTEVI